MFLKLIQIASLQGGLNTNLVILGTTILGFSAGLLGIFVVLRKEAMSIDAISHGTLPGVSLSFILLSFFGEGKNLFFLLFGAFISCLITTYTIYILKNYSKLKEDTSIAIALSSYFGFGVLLLSYIQVYDLQNASGIKSYIYGQAAALSEFDIILMISILLIILITILSMFKELLISSFDRDFSKIQGINIKLSDVIIYTLVILLTVVGIQAVGMLLILSLLVIPPVAARLWTDKIITLSFLSALFGSLSGYIGSVLSSIYSNVPTGAIIVIVSGVIFFISFLISPKKGLISGLLKQLLLRSKVIGEHLLIENYESLQRISLLNNEEFSFRELRIVGRYLKSLSYTDFLLAFFWLAYNFYGSLYFTGLKLSKLGFIRASAIEKNNKLWKTYITHFGNISDTHVNYSTDLVEHVLKPEVVKELETILNKNYQT